jgi:modulator of FtsH protease HflK
MAGSGGPWGGGGGGDDEERRPNDGRRGGDDRRGQGPQIPDVDRLMKQGQERLRVLMGGGGGGGTGGGGAAPGGAGGFLNRQTLFFGAIALLLGWSYMSFYTVKPEEQSVELLFGQFKGTKGEGLSFAPWPVVTAEIVNTSRQNTTEIGAGEAGENDTGLMLTSDQNIVDIEFGVVWNIKDPKDFLFNLADPNDTIRAVSESVMRDIIARSELAPVLNRDRGVIAAELTQRVQEALDSYQSGISVIRVNFDRADPPREVIDSFRAVQAAQQQRDTLQKEADAYANKVTAKSRGDAAQIAQEAQGYSARVVNQAEGDAARFLSIYEEYVKAPDVTRQRLYLEAMEKVLSGMNKMILDGVEAGGGVVPYLPLEGLSPAKPAGGSN